MHISSMLLFARFFVVYLTTEVKGRNRISSLPHESAHDDLNIKLNLPWFSAWPAIWIYAGKLWIQRWAQKRQVLIRRPGRPCFCLEVLQFSRKVEVLSFLLKTSVRRSRELAVTFSWGKPATYLTAPYVVKYCIIADNHVVNEPESVNAANYE